MTIAKINPMYSASVTVTGGRQGTAKSDDGVLDLRLASPGAKDADGATNPEQLFAAVYGACYQSALQSAARKKGLDVSAGVVDANVSLGKDDDGNYGIAVTLSVSIPGLEPAQVQALADDAHQICPYSRATRGNIDVTIKVA